MKRVKSINDTINVLDSSTLQAISGAGSSVTVSATATNGNVSVARGFARDGEIVRVHVVNGVLVDDWRALLRR